MSAPSFLHLQPTPVSSLPSHPSLPPSTTRPALHAFIFSTLTEANTFISSTVPEKLKVDKKMRPSPPSRAWVELSSATIHPDSGSTDREDGEHWVSRRSVHEDLAEPGTASFEEFVSGLRDNHTENEMKYTPSVSDVERILEWDCGKDGEVGNGWKDVKMAVMSITHTFNPSFLISPRTFLVLIITASLPPASPASSTKQTSGFLNLQLPISHNDLQKLGPSISKRGKGIFARYASVEKVTFLPPACTEENSESSSTQRRIEWRAATTSDAGGWIPKCVQRSWYLGGVPKAVVHDVGLFMAWVDRQRKL